MCQKNRLKEHIKNKYRKKMTDEQNKNIKIIEKNIEKT